MNETLEPRVLITKESAQGIVPGSPVNLNNTARRYSAPAINPDI
jgi:hypothetical protein